MESFHIFVFRYIVGLWLAIVGSSFALVSMSKSILFSSLQWNRKFVPRDDQPAKDGEQNGLLTMYFFFLACSC